MLYLKSPLGFKVVGQDIILVIFFTKGLDIFSANF